MVVHSQTKLTPRLRKQLAFDFYEGKLKKVELMRKYGVSFPTIQKVLFRARHGDFGIHKSINKRYQCLEYGLRRLSKVQKNIEAKLRRQAKRYEKSYPGELFHFDTKRLPLLVGEKWPGDRPYLFVAIDDYSRELYAGIYWDKSMWSSARFLSTVIQQCPYTIERILTDNGTEYKGKYGEHDFMRTAAESGIKQSFTRVARPQTNGKAERVIRTIMEGWHDQVACTTTRERRLTLNRFVNYYNCVKPHKGIDNQTPLERLYSYFYQQKWLVLGHAIKRQKIKQRDEI